MATIKQLLQDILDKNNDFKDKDTVNNSSFLYIKSYHNDNGERPITNTTNVMWNSDLKLKPKISSTITLWRQYWKIIPNTEYEIKCKLTNTGDLGITAANLELFLLDFEGLNNIFDPKVDPTARIELGTIQMYSVHEHSQTDIVLEWNSGDNSGPVAIAARVSSQSPVDLPNDWDTLNPREERHCANFYRLWWRLDMPFVFNDTVNNDTETGEYQYVLKLMPDSNKLISKELKRMGLTLQKSKLPSNITFETKVSNSNNNFKLIPQLRPNIIGSLLSLFSTAREKTIKWNFNISQRTIYSIRIKAKNVRLKKDHAIAYELSKINRKNNKVIGSVTILHVEE